MEAVEVAKKARAGLRWTALGMVISTLLRLAQVTVLARILGPSAFGVIAVLMIIVDFSRLLSEAGLAAAVIQRKTISHEQQSTLYWLNLGFGVIVYLILLITAPYIENLFGFSGLAALISVTGVAIIFMGAGTQIQSMIRRRMEFGKMVFTTNFSLFVGLSVMCVSATLYSQGIWSFVWGVIAETIVSLMVLFWFGVKGNILPKFQFSLGSVKGLLAFGGYRSGALLANLLASRTDQILIGTFFSASSLGMYNLAYNFSSVPVKKLNAIVTKVAFPAFSRLQEDRSRLREGYLSMIEAISIVAAPLTAGLAGIAPVFVPYVFGDEWAGGVNLIQIVLIYGFFLSVTRPMGTLIVGVGHANWSLYWNLGTLVLKGVVISLAALSGSIYVVAATLVCLSCALLPVSHVLMLRRIIGSAFFEMLYRIVKPAIAAVLMCVSVLFLGSLLQEFIPVVQLAILVPFGALVYLGLGWFLFKDTLGSLVRVAWG